MSAADPQAGGGGISDQSRSGSRISGENSAENQDEIDAIAEDFADRLRRGDHPRITDYLARHGDHAASLADLLPTIEGLERMRNQRDGKAPKTLGAYKIIREIGRGGMGVVYEAEEAGLERRVAIKVLPPAFSLDDIALKRFQREARLAARLVHPNIIPIHAFGQDGGSPYFAMHLVDGLGLDHLVDELSAGARPGASGDPLVALVRELRDGGARRGQGNPRTRAYRASVANVIAQAADALAFAHAEGVLHRDVKPSNLILDTTGRLWVSDFGLAVTAADDRLTTSGNVSGTLAYMAPERFDGIQDARSDIYGLGLALFEMLALRPAFSASSATDLFAAVISGRIPHLGDVDPEAPQTLARIVARATARDPKDRYGDAAALARDLRETVTNAGAPTAATVVGLVPEKGAVKSAAKAAGISDDGSAPTLRDSPSPKRKTIPPGERMAERTVHPAVHPTGAGIRPVEQRKSRSRRVGPWVMLGIATAALILLAVGSSFLVGTTPTPVPAQKPATAVATAPVAPAPAPAAVTVAAPPATTAVAVEVAPAATVAAVTADPPAPSTAAIPAAVPNPLPDPPPVAQVPAPIPAATVAAPAAPAPPVIPAPPIPATHAAADPGPVAQQPDPGAPKKPKSGKKPQPGTDGNGGTAWKPGDPPPGAPPGWTPPPPPGAPAGWKPGDPVPPPPGAPPGWQPGDPPPGGPPGAQPGWTPWGGNPPPGQNGQGGGQAGQPGARPGAPPPGPGR